MSDAAERRCSACGALVTADAEWCGQCFASLRPASDGQEPVIPEPTASAPRAGTGTGTAEPVSGEPSETAAAFWPCPVCHERNPIAAEVCQTCGTPFAQAMRGGADRPQVSARDARTRSLIFPGLGHRAVGMPTDGFVRGVLFVVSLGIAVLAGWGGTGSGALLAIVVVNLSLAVGVYVLSAIEAARLAEGGDLIVPSKTLLWILVGDVFLSIAIVGFAVVSATRG